MDKEKELKGGLPKPKVVKLTEDEIALRREAHTRKVAVGKVGRKRS